MNIKSNLIVAMAVLSAMAFSFASCSDEMDDNEEKTKVEEPTISVPVNISAALGSKVSTRSIGMKDDEDGKLSYNFDQLYEQQETDGAAFDFIVCSRYTSDDDKVHRVYQLFEDVPIQKKADGTYYISLTTDKVLVSSYAANHLGDVKFCGMLIPNGTGNTFFSFCQGGVEKDMAELAGAGGDFFVPLYSSTTATSQTWSGDGSADNSSFNITMSFSMMGTAITAKFTGNPLANDVYIDSVRIRDSNVKSGVITWLMGDEDDSGHPKFTFKGNGENNNKKIGFPQPMLVESDLFRDEGETFTARAWVMPVEDGSFTTDYDIYYRIKGDVDFTPLVVNYPQDASKKTTHNGGFKYGKVYTLSMQMPESDLMITEFEHLNPGAGGKNYTMIELYNPTAKKIDLRNYGLVRLTDFQRPSSASDAELAEGTSPYTYWMGYNNGATKQATLLQARVQDIYIDKTEGTWWTSSYTTYTRKNYYQGPNNCKLVSGGDNTTFSDDYHNTFSIFDGKNYNTEDQGNYTNDDNNTKFNYPAARKYKYNIGTHSNYEVELEPYELGPGQTVIVGAAGIIFEQNMGHGLAVTTEYWHSKGAYFNSSYLDNAAKNDRLKFAVAVDNGSSINVTGSDENSGVMQHTMRTVMQLVRLDTKEIIDMPGYMGNTASRYVYSEYIARSTSKNTIQRDYFVFSRFPSAMYPMYLNSRYYADHENRTDLLERAMDDTSVTGENVYRMYDWKWCFQENFNISKPNAFTLQDYLATYYSPGTKSFEAAIYSYTE